MKLKKLALFLAIFIFIILLASCAPKDAGEDAEKDVDPVRVTFYGLDKADATLITLPDGRRILIDAGRNKDGKRLAERFEEEGIENLDVLIVTHFDKDHVGGADQILKAVDVSRVIMPSYEEDSGQYKEFLEALEQSVETQVDIMGAEERLELPYSDVRVSVTSAHKTFYGDNESNDFSLAVRLCYGDTRFLFPGDAEEARQMELLAEGDVACDVLKLPHHGRLHDTSSSFIRAASPAIAFVPEGKDNPADPTVLSLLELVHAQVYSSLDGDLTVVSDGKTVRAEKQYP